MDSGSVGGEATVDRGDVPEMSESATNTQRHHNTGSQCVGFGEADKVNKVSTVNKVTKPNKPSKVQRTAPVSRRRKSATAAAQTATPTLAVLPSTTVVPDDADAIRPLSTPKTDLAPAPAPVMAVPAATVPAATVPVSDHPAPPPRRSKRPLKRKRHFE